jgi:hypothetical protein
VTDPINVTPGDAGARARSLDGVMRDVELVVSQLLTAQQELRDLGRFGSGVALEADLIDELRQRMARNRGRLQQLLESTMEFPPRHVRHFALLEQFWRDGGYEESVFIMSKFPDGTDGAKDGDLERVLAVASEAISEAGFSPRIARGASRYHDALWDNVELHLLGCRQGIAIVEDKYRNELNPNVAMEWGWMRGMGKSVLFMIEESFTHSRADISGLIEQSFRWTDPEADMAAAIETWLESLGR